MPVENEEDFELRFTEEEFLIKTMDGRVIRANLIPQDWGIFLSRSDGSEELIIFPWHMVKEITSVPE